MQIKPIVGSIDIQRVVPYFQPVMDLQHKAVWSYECLARLISEDEELYLPSEFLYLIRRDQCFGELTQRVFCASAEYFRNNQMSWSINISHDDINKPNLLQFLCSYLQNYPNPQRITLELTATSALHCNEEFKSFLLICKALELRLFIDNFADVRENVTRVLDLPIDGIKLDGELIKALNDSKRAKSSVYQLFQMAEARDVMVIAEHIENEAALRAVQQLGIRYGQGFYFSKPIPSVKTH